MPISLWKENIFVQEAQLQQRDHAMHYVSKVMLCFTSYKSYKGFKQQKSPLRSCKGIGNGAIR